RTEVGQLAIQSQAIESKPEFEPPLIAQRDSLPAREGAFRGQGLNWKQGKAHILVAEDLDKLNMFRPFKARGENARISVHIVLSDDLPIHSNREHGRPMFVDAATTPINPVQHRVRAGELRFCIRFEQLIVAIKAASIEQRGAAEMAID